MNKELLDPQQFILNYCIVQNFDVFDAYQLDRQNLTHQIV